MRGSIQCGRYTMREAYNAGGIQCKRSTMQRSMIWHAMVGHYTCSTNEFVRDAMSYLFASIYTFIFLDLCLLGVVLF